MRSCLIYGSKTWQMKVRLSNLELVEIIGFHKVQHEMRLN